MKRLAFLLLGACWSSSPAPAVEHPLKGSASTPVTVQPTYPRPDFAAPTKGLAVGIAAFLVIDDERGRVYVRETNNIATLALDSGKELSSIDIGQDGELWPAGTHLVSVRGSGQTLDVVFVDPATNNRSSCTQHVKAPPTMAISRVDEFTTHAGTTYLKWEGSEPAPMRGGAAMRPDEIDAMAQKFQSTYACGLFAVHVKDGQCRLDVATYKDAGLDSCETREMPWNRYLPTPIGNLVLSIDRRTDLQSNLYTDYETLIVKDRSGAERWRKDVVVRAVPPPAP